MSADPANSGITLENIPLTDSEMIANNSDRQKVAQTFYDDRYAGRFVKPTNVANGGMKRMTERLEELEGSQRGNSSSISLDLTATLGSTDITMAELTPASAKDVTMEELPPVKFDPYGGASGDTADASEIEQICSVFDATGNNLEEDAQLQEPEPTTDWDTFTFSEVSEHLNDTQKKQCKEEYERLNKGEREKETVEQVHACLHRGATVDFDRMVAILVQVKLKAKALENVITRQYLEAVQIGGSVDEQQRAAYDIRDAHVQCQEALMATLMNTGTGEIRVDPQDI